MHGAPSLGRLLLTSGLLTQQALDEVLVVQKTDGRRLGELLAERGLVRPHQLAQFLSHQLSCPWVSLNRVEISREAVDLLPRDVALKHHMVPVHLRTSKGGATALYVAMDDPTDDVALAEAAAAATVTVKPMIALTSEIRSTLDRLYGVVTPTPPEIAPTITLKEDSSPAVTKTTTGRPTKPPPPKATVPPPAKEETILDEVEVIDEPPSQRAPTIAAKVLVVDSEEAFLTSVREAAARLGAETIGVSLPDLSKMLADLGPCAIIVTEEVYANVRAGLDRLALDAGAQLLVSSNDFQSRLLEGLLEGAIRRWQRAPYEKGSILEGRYELLRDLGGRVSSSRWEVRHLKTARRSVLKVGVRAAHDETDAEAVRREQQALARVQHPGAVELRDAGITELGDPYIVVEPLEGRTLEGLVAARGALQTEEAFALVRQVGSVLVAAHEAGVRHGDVKPEHVLVIRDAWGVERAKLAHWESSTLSSAIDVDLTGLAACAFLALVGRTRNEGEAVTTAIDARVGAVLEQRFGSVKDFLEAFDRSTPRPSEPVKILEANPERRGQSLRPAAPTAEAPLPSELRQFTRANYRTPVRVEVAGVGAVDGRSEDISEGGLFVVARGKIAEGAQVTVRFALPIDGKVVSEAGVIRWTRAPKSGETGEPRGIGIEFSSASEESLKQIARYVSFMAV